MSAAIAPELLVFDDEVIVATEDLRLSFAIEREYAALPSKGEPTGYITPYLAVRWRDSEQLANYTPTYEHAGGARFLPNEIHVTADGLLSALNRQPNAMVVDVRHGFTLQLPPGFIEPVQAALQTITQQLNDELATTAGATPDDQASD
jgi:hypothetical protein